MKFMHLSDLHIGKRVNEYSMLEDQKDILKQIMMLMDEQKPDAVVIAGDIYDKSVPGADAVMVFDWFLTLLSERKVPVFLISGNHDSSERLAFGKQILSGGNIYVSEVYQGKIEKITKKDAYGEVNFYLIPFLKPAVVRHYLKEQVTDYQSAMEAVIKSLDLDTSKRNVLIVHQFLTGALRSDSEETAVGGLDDISAEIFADADYVALGHLHRPQSVLKDTIRYCGTPLKYSFSEVNQEKSVTFVTMREKGDVRIETRALHPLRDMRKIKGSYLELTNPAFYKGTKTDDYLSVILTDEEEIPEVFGKLSVIYSNIMKLEYDNRRMRAEGIDFSLGAAEEKSPGELFADFYEKQNGMPMSKEQSAYLSELIETIWEGGK